MGKQVFKNSINLIDFFKVIVINPKENCPQITQVSIFDKLQKPLFERGYIISVDACRPECLADIEKYIEYKTVNPNSTFYKTVEDVVSKSRLEILFDQLFHYQTTYGTNFQGTPYVNNPDYAEMGNILWDSYTVLKAESETEFFNRINKTLDSGVALSAGLINDIGNFIVSFADAYGWANHDKSYYASSIKNKELKRFLMSEWKVRPETALEMFEYIHSFTGTSLIVKNKNQVEMMKRAALNNETLSAYINSMSVEEMKELSSIFYRYKPFFLALKHNIVFRSFVNKLRKYATKFHKPMWESPWVHFISTIDNMSPSDVEAYTLNCLNSSRITNYKLITIMSAIEMRKNEINTYMESNKNVDDENNVSCKLYRIRNGLSYVDKTKCRPGNLYSLTAAYKTLRDFLIKRLALKKGTVLFPAGLTLVCPTSEKNFVGDIPFGSYLNIGHKDAFVGIYWENEWGAYDLDLSALTDNGERIGWCGSYNNCGVVYSGDMTNAANGATEILYRHVGSKSFNVHVNKYTGVPKTHFNLFFGTHDFSSQLDKNQFIDSNWVKYSCTLRLDDVMGKMVGRVIRDKFYFVDLNARLGRVSQYMCDEESDAKAYDNTVESKVALYDILYRAGFEKYNPEVHEKLDYDLSDKQVLLDLFA